MNYKIYNSKVLSGVRNGSQKRLIRLLESCCQEWKEDITTDSTDIENNYKWLSWMV